MQKNAQDNSLWNTKGLLQTERNIFCESILFLVSFKLYVGRLSNSISWSYLETNTVRQSGLQRKANHLFREHLPNRPSQNNITFFNSS
jgi:hypothetical protein